MQSLSMSNQIEISSPLKSIYSKSNPYISKISQRKLLSSNDSTKATYHVSLAIDDTVEFKPGDSIGIYPENPSHEITQLLSLLNVLNSPSDLQISELKKKNLQLVTLKFCRFIMSFIDCETLNLLEQSLQSEDYLKSHDIYSFLDTYKIVKPLDFSEFLLHLSPMAPRFYSIASSTKVYPSEIHLLIKTFNYDIKGRLISGLGSSFLCNYAQEETTPIPFFIHPSRNFCLPSDPSTPIIMIGPGTGVAPFKAFLEERFFQGADQNWLFFGERNRNCDFYYEDEFTKYEGEGFLKLSLAFSRDQAHKIYVQHLILDQMDLFYDWLSRGAIVYVCGDAKNMAKDVQNALCAIFAKKELLSEEQSLERFKELKRQQKIIFEVY